MKKILILLTGVVIGALSATIFFTTSINKESTKDIDNDIAIFSKKITDVDAEIAKYSGGLVLSLLKSQREIYQNSVAALQQKRAQIAHWIVFNYNIDSKHTMPHGSIENYKREIEEINKKIEHDTAESALYSPCLVKSLIESRIAQNKFSLSGVERALIAQKYNIPFILLPNEAQKSEDKPKASPVKQSPEEDLNSL